MCDDALIATATGELPMKNVHRAAIMLAFALPLAGCADLFMPNQHRHERNASSLVDFLYPDKQSPPVQDTIPELHLPLRVGVAFLPPNAGAVNVLDAVHKEGVLERIRERFRTRGFVSDITIIPDYYLAAQRGFDGLQGLQRLYNVDVVALVSYDQVRNQDDKGLSLGYLTIVGAYVLHGTRQDVSTLVDLAVVHPGTRSLVLRAGGVDTRHSNSSLVRADRELRETGTDSFDAAAARMMDNFDAALLKFESDVRDGKARVKVTRNGNSGGAGAVDWLTIALLGIAVTLTALRARRT
jgi:rhombotail lipoprotein